MPMFGGRSDVDGLLFLGHGFETTQTPNAMLKSPKSKEDIPNSSRRRGVSRLQKLLASPVLVPKTKNINY